MQLSTAIHHQVDTAFDGPMRILVVDDSRVQRSILSASLRKWGFAVDTAESGHAALEICKHAPPDLVISDWMMPKMNGVEFCRRFRRLPLANYGYFILLTSKTEKNAVARGLECGADDFLSKPVDPVELRARLKAGQRVLRMERELQAKSHSLSDALGEIRTLYDAIDRDLRQARKIQQSLVPERTQNVGKTEISMLLKPAGHVGGDLVGMFHSGLNRIGIYAIDVSGHGVTSALLAARLASYLSGRFLDQNIALKPRMERFYTLRPPIEVAQILNDRLLADHGVEEYFTMVYATVDLSSGVTRMVQAGHPYPALQRADGTVEFLGDGGPPVGLLSDVRFECCEFTLRPGDRLLLYSDGFIESEDQTGIMLQEEGLSQMLRKWPKLRGPKLLDRLYSCLSRRHGVEHTTDDVSALLLEFNGPE